MRRKLSTPVKVILEVALLAALVVLFIMVLDPKQLRGYLLKVTWVSLLGLMAFQFSVHIVGAAQWVVLLRQAGIMVSPWRVFWSRLSGCAITSLTPSAYFGGEPVRAAMLKNATMSYQNVFATIAVDKYIELFTKFPVALLGFASLIMLARPPVPLLVVSTIFVVFFFGLFFLIMVKLFQGGSFIVSMFKVVLRPFTRWKPRSAGRVIRVVRDFTGSVKHIIKSKRAFYLAMSLGLLLSVVELFQYAYVLSVLGIYSVPDAAIIFFGHVFLGIFSVIPGNVGSMEGVFLFVFSILGLGSDRSLIFSVMMRIGQIIMVALGVANILVSRISRKIAKGADRIRTGA